VVVNAAIVAGKAARPAGGSGDGTGKVPTYLGSISVLRGRCIVTVTPASITVERRSVPWSHNASISCHQRRHFRVDIVAARQVFSERSIMLSPVRLSVVCRLSVCRL